MASETRPLDITDSPELLRWAEEVQRTGVGRVLKRGKKELALLTPISRSVRTPRGEPSRQEGQKSPADAEADAILNIIGIGESAEPTDIARHELEYLAEAFAPKTR